MSTSTKQPGAASAASASTPQAQATQAEIAMAQLLQGRDLLGSLDFKILKDIMSRCFPGREAEIFHEQMMNHLYGHEDSGIEPGGMYLDDGTFFEACFRQHLKYLCSFRDTELYAVEIIGQALQCVLEPAYNAWAFDDLPEICEPFSGMMLDVVEGLLAQHEQQGKYEKVVSVMNGILAAHKELDRDILADIPSEIKDRYEGNPSFQHSMAAVANWHHNRVAPMLAMKVAGDVLPAELVDLILSIMS